MELSNELLAKARAAKSPEELLALGVNVPRATTLMNALSAQGLYAGPTVRNVAGAAAALKEVLA